MAPSSSSLFLSNLSRKRDIDASLLSSSYFPCSFGRVERFSPIWKNKLYWKKKRIFLEERNFSIYYSFRDNGIDFWPDFRNMNIVIDISL